jgi:hypothetical protein
MKLLIFITDELLGVKIMVNLQSGIVLSAADAKSKIQGNPETILQRIC